MSISLQEESKKFADLLTNPTFIPKLCNQSYIFENANEFKTGDIVYTSDTNEIYVKLDSGLSKISNGFDNTIEDSYKDKELDNQVLRCKSCGSVIDPSKVDRNNNITCPYCDSVNHIFVKE